MRQAQTRQKREINDRRPWEECSKAARSRCPKSVKQSLFTTPFESNAAQAIGYVRFPVIGQGWSKDCLIHRMANLTLAPEDDDPDFLISQKTGSGSLTELQRLHLHFSPDKVGFGLTSPWPGLEQMLGVDGNAIKCTEMSQDKKDRQ